MPRQGLTRTDVLRACLRLIDEKGFEGFSMHELARRLNIRPASLYNHVENESTLLARIGQTATERFARALEEAVENKTGEEALASLADAWLNFADVHAGLYAVVWRTLKPGTAKPAFLAPVEQAAGGGAARDFLLAVLHGVAALRRVGVLSAASAPEAFTSTLTSLWK